MSSLESLLFAMGFPLICNSSSKSHRFVTLPADCWVEFCTFDLAGVREARDEVTCSMNVAGLYGRSKFRDRDPQKLNRMCYNHVHLY